MERRIDKSEQVMDKRFEDFKQEVRSILRQPSPPR
jgi:hypothetical protein